MQYKHINKNRTAVEEGTTPDGNKAVVQAALVIAGESRPEGNYLPVAAGPSYRPAHARGYAGSIRWPQRRSQRYSSNVWI
ncbi:hypothetical protein JYU34_013722 [Plutella xylostella]|uniref:Uncharacterized protein n=1 Tax=Plutella xylostella TaxID=51655 RepID=A0ABQ7QAM6_PLUXY|nr:hypothetical protein JYU34_013722 [Plutella xylostella]